MGRLGRTLRNKRVVDLALLATKGGGGGTFLKAQFKLSDTLQTRRKFRCRFWVQFCFTQLCCLGLQTQEYPVAIAIVAGTEPPNRVRRKPPAAPKPFCVCQKLQRLFHVSVVSPWLFPCVPLSSSVVNFNLNFTLNFKLNLNVFPTQQGSPARK